MGGALDNKYRPALLAVFAYFVLSLVFTYPLILHFNTHIPAGGMNDPLMFLWNCWNFQDALVHPPHNPLTAPSFLYPFEPNLSFHTYTISRSVLVMILNNFFNMITSFNIVTILMFTFSGFGAYLLTLRFTNSHFAAFISGLIFSFCPFKLARLLGHYNFIDSAFIPFYILFLYRSFERRSVKNAAAAGIFLALIGYCSYYYLFFTAIFTIAFIAYYLFPGFASFAAKRILSEKMSRRLKAGSAVVLAPILCVIAYTALIGDIKLPFLRIGNLSGALALLFIILAAYFFLKYKIRAKELLAAAKRNVSSFFKDGIFVNFILILLIFLLLFSPILINIMEQHQEYLVKIRGEVRSPAVADLLIPCKHSSLNKFILQLESRKQQNIEKIIPIGCFVLILAIFAALVKVNDRHRGFWSMIALVFILFSLGPILRSHGRELLRLPYALIESIPIIRGARLPARYIIMTMLALGILSSYPIARLIEKARTRHISRNIAAFAAVVLLVVICLEYITVPIRLCSIDVPAFYRKVAEEPGKFAILEIPFRIRAKGHRHIGGMVRRNGLFQYWQTIHKKNLLSGDLAYAPAAIWEYYKRNAFIRTICFLQDRQNDIKLKKELLSRRMDKDKDRLLACKYLQLYNVKYIVLHKSKFDLNRDSFLFLVKYLKQEIPYLQVKEHRKEQLVYQVPQRSRNYFIGRSLLLPKNDLALVDGWSGYMEKDGIKGRFARKRRAKIVFPVLEENNNDLCLKMQVNHPFPHKGEKWSFKVYLNHSLIQTIEIPASPAHTRAGRDVEIELPAGKVAVGSNIVSFNFSKLSKDRTAAWFSTLEIAPLPH